MQNEIQLESRGKWERGCRETKRVEHSRIGVGQERLAARDGAEPEREMSGGPGAMDGAFQGKEVAVDVAAVDHPRQEEEIPEEKDDQSQPDQDRVDFLHGAPGHSTIV